MHLLFIWVRNPCTPCGLLTLSLSQGCSHLRLKSPEDGSAAQLTPGAAGTNHIPPEALGSLVYSQASPCRRPQQSCRLHQSKQARQQVSPQKESHGPHPLISDATSYLWATDFSVHFSYGFEASP